MIEARHGDLKAIDAWKALEDPDAAANFTNVLDRLGRQDQRHGGVLTPYGIWSRTGRWSSRCLPIPSAA